MISNHALSIVVHFVRSGYLHMFENKTPMCYVASICRKKLAIPLSLTAE